MKSEQELVAASLLLRDGRPCHLNGFSGAMVTSLGCACFVINWVLSGYIAVITLSRLKRVAWTGLARRWRITVRTLKNENELLGVVVK